MLSNPRELYTYDISTDRFLFRVDIMCRCNNCNAQKQIEVTLRRIRNRPQHNSNIVSKRWLREKQKLLHSQLKIFMFKHKLKEDTSFRWEYPTSCKTFDDLLQTLK